MNDLQREVRDRTISGFRWVVVLNLLTAPLSLATNMLFGRTSAVVLGYYSAVLIFVGSFDTFLYLGGREVYTRFVPTLNGRDRLSFVLSYTFVVLCVPVLLVLLGATVLKAPVLFLLQRFGDPPIPVAIALAIIVILLCSATRHLYGVLEARPATLALRFVVVGFFVSALLAYWPLRDQLMENPSTFLWAAGLLVYLVACVFAIFCVGRITGAEDWRNLRWFLPRGFWAVVFYAQSAALVAFVYTSLSPAVVLLWLDVGSLARLHAALRIVVLLKMVPVMLANVLAPALARLDASGLRDEALRDASAALRTMIFLTGSASLVLILFSGDAMALFGSDFRGYRNLLRIVAVSGMAAPLVYLGGGMVAAFGSFRTYLLASIVYVAIALALTGALVPLYGLTGAAVATTLGAFVHHASIAIVLRLRLNFRIPMRVYAAWGCGAAACMTALIWDPGRLTSAILLVAFLVAFAVLGRVTWRELKNATKLLALRA